ncbi:transcription factor bHLH113-like isoform X1 [Capsicum annuum]|uniref:transcription factor bHLH113-like isoform X1 n=1 Tax=Capsicum annuum TaxID=4072 RepID=UPI001FB0EFF3|nr:transcription factor bHLH113-like isoform X1 [Capsicum annuum]
MRPRKGASEVKKRKKLQRSLKDKIAAAQKLVSPNGKVETAPVLRETCNAIKAVKKQIQDLCNTASNVGSLFQSQVKIRVIFSYFINQCISLRELFINDVNRIAGGKEIDVQSEVFCLVPVSLVQKVTDRHLRR